MSEREIISWKEARALGLKRFYTGMACDSGHISERLVSSKQCMECCKKRQEARRRKAGIDPRPPVMTRDAAREREKLRKRAIHRAKYVPTGRRYRPPMGEARRIAMASGQELFFSGRPCKRGHLERRTSDGKCVECERIRARERYRSKTPPSKYPRVPKKTFEEKRATQSAYRHTHVEENRRRNALRRARKPEEHRKRERERARKVSDLIAVLRAENPELLKEFGL